MWVNLGVTYDNKSDYTKAAQYFLSAVSLNPNAKHIWGYLRSTFGSANREDLTVLAQKMDVNAFKDMFYIASKEHLPPPKKSITHSVA